MKTIALTMEEQKRVEVIQRVFRGEVTMAEAAMVLGVYQRHSYRIKARIREEGVKGIIHGNRGRICHWKLSAKTYGRIVELAKGEYREFNDHHLTEKLTEEEGSGYLGRRSARSFVLRGSLLLAGDVPPDTAVAGREEPLRG